MGFSGTGGNCQTVVCLFFHNGKKNCWCWKAWWLFFWYVVMETNIWLRVFSTVKWSHPFWAHVGVGHIFTTVKRFSTKNKKLVEEHLHTSLLCFPQNFGEMRSATSQGKSGCIFTSYYSFTYTAVLVRLSEDAEYWSADEFTHRQTAFSLFITVVSALKRQHQYSVQPVTQATALPGDTSSGIKSLLDHFGCSGIERMPEREENFNLFSPNVKSENSFQNFHSSESDWVSHHFIVYAMCV